MTHWRRALPMLLVVAAAACGGGTDGDSGATAVFPLTPSGMIPTPACAGALSAHAPPPGSTLGIGTVAIITLPGTYELPAATALRVSLRGTGDYFVFTRPSADTSTTTYTARGIAEGNLRQWTLHPPGGLQLNPSGSGLTVMICAE